MNENKLRILNLIMDMWQNDLIEGNGAEDFENWCEDNIDNSEQQELLELVKKQVDQITYILADDDF